MQPKKNNLPFIRKVFADNQYDWMLQHLLTRIMYVHTWIDSQHKMWIPRWGVSDKQMVEAEKLASELFEVLSKNERII